MNDHTHVVIWAVLFSLLLVGDDCGSTRRRIEDLETRIKKLEAKQ